MFSRLVDPSLKKRFSQVFYAIVLTANTIIIAAIARSAAF
jgi:hypothetical protein